MSDQDLTKQIEAFKEATAGNKNVDISALMLNALEREQQHKIPAKQKRLAYFISIAFPPFGLIFSLKYYFSDYIDGKRTALYCAIMTIAVIIFTTMILNIIISSTGTSVEQFQQTPDQLRSLLQN